MKKEKNPLRENPPMLVTIYLLNANSDTKIPVAMKLAGSNFLTNIRKKIFSTFSYPSHSQISYYQNC